MSLFFISQFIHQLLLCWHLWHQKLLFNATQKYIVESIIVWWLFPKSWLLCMCLRFLQNNRITQTEKSFITRHPTVIHLIQKYIIFQTYHPIESIPIEQWHMTNSYVCTNPLILMKWWWRRIMGGILRMAACVLRSFFTYEYRVVALSRRTQYDQLTQPVVTIYHNNWVATMMRAWSYCFIVDGTYDDESDFDHRPMHQLWSKIAKQQWWL